MCIRDSFSGEQQPMLKSDTLVVTRDNYRTVLSDDDLGRLVRFEGVEKMCIRDRSWRLCC